MKRGVLFCALLIGLMTVACNTAGSGDGSHGIIENDAQNMGYHGAVKAVKIERFVPDARAGVGLALGKTITLGFDEKGRLLSSTGIRDVSKSCIYGKNGKVSEIVELYHDLKVHIFHSYDTRGNCVRMDLYRVQQGDSVLMEERLMEYNDKDSIVSYTSLPKPEDRIQTAVLYTYDKNDCMVEKRVYSALVAHKLDLSGEPITHIKTKYDAYKRPVEIENFSLVEDIFTKRIEYNEHGHISKEEILKPDAEPETFTYEYTYGGSGKKVEVRTFEGGVRVKQVRYNDAEQPLVIETLDADGQVVTKKTFEYDAQGNVVVMTSANLDAEKRELVEVYKEVKTIDYYE